MCQKSIAVVPYIKGVSETLRRTLQVRHDIRSRLVRPKDAADPKKQDGVVYRIPCECGKVYIGQTGRPIQERIKEHSKDIRLARTQSSAVSEHVNETGHKPLWVDVNFNRDIIIIILRHPRQWHRKTGSVDASNKETSKQTCGKQASQRTPGEIIVNRNNSQIETHQSAQTKVIYNTAPKTVDPIA